MYSSRKLTPILNAMLVFEEAAKHNSFTKAGERLGMAQPSVSRFIANLESHLEVTLFERRHNKLSLTENGEILYRASVSGFDEIRAACAKLESESRSRILTVECTHGFAQMWLLPRIQSLMADLPGWKLRLISSEGGTQLSTSEADLVVRQGDGEWEHDESLLLFKETAFPVCSPEFSRRHGLDLDRFSVNDIRDLPLVIQDFGEHEWLDWVEWFAGNGVEYRYPKDTLPVSNYALCLQAAMEGKGIALAWEQLADPYLSNKWLLEIPGLRMDTIRGYYLVFSPDSKVAVQVRRWVNEVLYQT
jgi:LysR family glycine cleavage system transcriptional activator